MPPCCCTWRCGHCWDGCCGCVLPWNRSNQRRRKAAANVHLAIRVRARVRQHTHAPVLRHVPLMTPPPSTAPPVFSPRAPLSEMLPLLGHSSPHRVRSRVVLLAAAALLVALALIAASGAPSTSDTPLVLRSAHAAASVKSEDRFVSAQDAYVRSMNGRGGLSVFDPRCAALQPSSLSPSSALPSPSASASAMTRSTSSPST